MTDDDRPSSGIVKLAWEALFTPVIKRTWDIAQNVSTAQLFEQGAGALNAVDAVLEAAWTKEPRAALTECPGFSSVSHSYIRMAVECTSSQLGRWLAAMPPDFQHDVLRTVGMLWIGRLMKREMPSDLYKTIEYLSVSGEEQVQRLASQLLRRLPDGASPGNHGRKGRHW